MMNHFSFLTIISLFDLNWRDQILYLFNFMNSYANSSPQSIFVIDCFLQEDPNSKFKQTFLFICISPLIFLILSYFFSTFFDGFAILFRVYLRKGSNLSLKSELVLMFKSKFKDQKYAKCLTWVFNVYLRSISTYLWIF